MVSIALVFGLLIKFYGILYLGYSGKEGVRLTEGGGGEMDVSLQMVSGYANQALTYKPISKWH